MSGMRPSPNLSSPGLVSVFLLSPRYVTRFLLSLHRIILFPHSHPPIALFLLPPPHISIFLHIALFLLPRHQIAIFPLSLHIALILLPPLHISLILLPPCHIPIFLHVALFLLSLHHSTLFPRPPLHVALFLLPPPHISIFLHIDLFLLPLHHVTLFPLSPLHTALILLPLPAFSPPLIQLCLHIQQRPTLPNAWFPAKSFTNFDIPCLSSESKPNSFQLQRRCTLACHKWSAGPDKTSVQNPQALDNKFFIYGKANNKVMVYVKVKGDTPQLVCMDKDTAHEELLDPYFLWIGPEGRNLKGQSNTDITDTGKLMLKRFDKSMSGSYSCTLSYSSTTYNLDKEVETFKLYSFIVLAYREPDYTYRISVRYTAKPCDKLANAHFFQGLVSIVQVVIDSLTCKVTDLFHKCHVVEISEGNLQNELFMSFTVSPFADNWEELCKEVMFDCEDETNTRVQKARDLIEEFFTLQPMFLKKDLAIVPEITYIEHSMEITRIDSCQPGFGKNENVHRDCSGCCVVCDPDTFNSMNNLHCEVCKDIRIPYYGSTTC